MTRWLPEDVERVHQKLLKRLGEGHNGPVAHAAEKEGSGQVPVPSKTPGARAAAASLLRKAKREAARDAFILQCVAYGLPEPIAEYKFHHKRNYRWDFCWVQDKVAIEVQGGLWGRGRAKAAHGMPLGILRDYEKSNLGQINGWTVLFYTPSQLRAALPEIKRALGVG